MDNQEFLIAPTKCDENYSAPIVDSLFIMISRGEKPFWLCLQQIFEKYYSFPKIIAFLFPILPMLVHTDFIFIAF